MSADLERDLREMLQRTAAEVEWSPVPTPGLVRRARLRRVTMASIAVITALALAGTVPLMQRSIDTSKVEFEPVNPGPNESIAPQDVLRTSPTPSVWSPLLERGQLGLVHRGRTYHDPQDASEDWVDLKRVSFSGRLQPHWSMRLQARPPRAAGLEPGRLIAYGVVLDTDGDHAADYVIGIDNAGPERGDFRTWVTDLATGQTDEQVGPPYGFPIEFIHPDEEGGNAGVGLWFLGGSAPPGVDSSARFYVWAAESRDGEIVASDYAPDGGWMGG